MITECPGERTYSLRVGSYFVFVILQAREGEDLKECGTYLRQQMEPEDRPRMHPAEESIKRVKPVPLNPEVKFWSLACSNVDILVILQHSPTPVPPSRRAIVKGALLFSRGCLFLIVF